MQKSLLLLFFIVFVAANYHSVQAQPSNDACFTPVTLSSATSCSYLVGSSLNATQSFASSCNGTPDDDVWFKFTAVVSSHTVQVKGYGSFDAMVEVLSGSPCSGTNLMCKDATGAAGLETLNLTGLTVGSTYSIRVYHYGSGDGGGDFDICVSHTAPPSPSNDLCSNAITISSSLTCNYTSGSTSGATQSIAGTCTGTPDDDVWYKFTAVATSHTVQVQGYGSFDAILNVRASTSCSGSNINCLDVSGAGGLETANLTGLTIGTTYLVRVYHYGSGSGGGSFDICVTHTAPPTPPNDYCGNATQLTSSLTCNYTTGSTLGATQSATGICTGTGDDDVWYSFVAVASDHTVNVQGFGTFDAVIDIRSNTSCAGTNIKCTDAAGMAGLETASLTELTIGATYLIRVYHYGFGSGGGDFNICVTHQLPPTPPNDLCGDAITLTSAQSCSYTSGSTTGGTQSIPGTCFGTGDDDVWYKFTAVSTNHVVEVQGESGFDAVVDCRAYSACSGTNLSCTDASGSGGLETVNLSGLTVGNDYWVRVYHFGTGSGTGDFQICITHTAPSCTYSISPANKSYTSSAGTGNVSVTAASGCNWTAVSNDSWITVTSGSSGSGNGTVSYSVSANTSASQRTGTITIAGQTHTVAQSGNTPCSYSISPSNQTFTSTGGNGSVSVSAANGCNWTAASNNSWITISSGGSGSGNGTVSYTVAANTSASSRTGTITAAGQIHTIIQNGAVPCSYTISPASLSYAASGGQGTVNVTASRSDCAWTAVSNNGWITITSGSSGAGTGTVNYTVASNSNSTQRTGTITVAGQTHTVTQNGIVCSYSIAPTALSYSSASATGTINVTATTGCSWTASTADSWITITSGATGTGNGSVSYSVSGNTSASQRIGSILVAGQTHTVVQNGLSSCAFTISPASQSFASNGGTGSLSVSTTSGCTWTAVANDGWIFISSGNNGSGNGTVNYSISANSSSSQRVGTITVGGQIYTVTQTGITCPAVPGIQSVGCALAADLISNVSYQWYISGTPIAGASSQFYTATQSGFYSVYVTDNSNGCVTASQPVYTTCPPVGIEEEVAANELIIYPNPARNNFSVKATGVFSNEPVKISIMNVFGQEVYASFTTPVNGSILLNIENTGLARGSYSVMLLSENVKIAKRVILF